MTRVIADGVIKDREFYGFSTATGLLVVLVIVSESGFIPVIDHANLAFHEAGHLFFGILGNTMGLYGGTLGQLVFPVVTAVVFFRRGEYLSLGLATLWFSENFLNIAHYTADARSQILPLVGGGDHDWTNILRRWDMLESDTAVAGVFTFIAWAGIVGSWSIFAWLWQRDRGIYK